MSSSNARAGGVLRALLIGGAAWLVLGVVVTLGWWMGLRACAVGGPFSDRFALFCRAPVDSGGAELAALEADGVALEAELAGLDAGLRLAPSCPTPTEVEFSPPETPLPPEQIEARAECPAADPSEVILLVDVSASMQYRIDTSPQDEVRWAQIYKRLNEIQARVDEASRTGGIFAQILAVASYSAEAESLNNESARIVQRMRGREPNRRIDYARHALTDLVDATSSDIDIQYLTFSQCRAPQDRGRYSSSERPQLQRAIAQTELEQSTALARAIQGLSQHIRGGRTPDEPANVVLVSDGQDTCGDDPCAAARQLSRDFPYTHISMIVVGGQVEVAQCITESTGGLLIEARDADHLAEALRQASGQEVPPECRM